MSIAGTMNFNAKHGCQRCSIIGKHSSISRTVVFTKLNQPLRTDALFRENFYAGHQKTRTPLIELPGVDMIRDFVVADPLHLLELGVMKRLIIAWRTGNMACFRWTDEEVDIISAFLLGIKTPCEINRDARSLQMFRLWKGQEFRNFLNYFGVVALRDRLPARIYSHFLVLFCAVRLASSEKYLHTNYLLIEKLFEKFVVDFKQIYGSEFMTSNIHNLLHISEDVHRFGILSSISAYPFENCLGKIKRIIRAGHSPLPQIAKRLIERTGLSSDAPSMDRTPVAPQIDRNGSKCSVIVADRSFMLSNHKFHDQWFLANGNIMKMVNAEMVEGTVFVESIKLMSKHNYFDQPFESSLINIYIANGTATSEATEKVNVGDIDCKFLCIQEVVPEDYVFIPVLHTEK